MKKRSRGQKRLFNEIIRIANSPRFQAEVFEFRKRHGIPDGGILFPKTTSLSDIAVGAGTVELARLNGYKWGKDYKYSRRAHAYLEGIGNEIITAVWRCGAYDMWIAEALGAFFFVDDIKSEDLRKLVAEHDVGDLDVCRIVSKDWLYKSYDEYKDHLKAYNKRRYPPYLDDLEMILYHEGKRKQYPMVLEISEYATLSNVKDFLARNWKSVQTSKMKEAHIPRARITWDKYDFIWKHRHVQPRSELASMVNKQFGSTHDAMYIRNIISRENKRRKA